MTSRSKAITRDSILAIAGVVLVAFNMRTAVSGLSPLYDIIDHDIHLGLAERAVFGALPPFGFVLGGVITPWISRRFGLERNLLMLLGLMVIGHVIRGIADSWITIAIGSAFVLVGSGMGNVSLPPVVKRYFPNAIGPLTSTYITCLSIGQIIPPLIAVPLSASTSWRVALGVWTLLAVAAMIPWILEIRRGHRSETLESVSGPKLAIRRSPTAWAVALSLTTSSITGYAMFAWLPDIVKQTAGLNNAEAGIALALFIGAGTPLALGIPILASRMRNVANLVYVGALLTVTGALGLAFFAAHAPYLWAFVLGTGPLLFPLSLMLINLRTESSSASLQLSAFAQFFAYMVSGTVAPLLGWARAVTGGWQFGLTGIACVALAAIWAARVLSRNHTVEAELRG
jgi:CP family cyanate transporter-like MFS transporter